MKDILVKNTFKLYKSDKVKLRKIARQRKISMSAFIRELIRNCPLKGELSL